MYFIYLTQPKQIELHLTTAEALVFAAMGVNSPAARDAWTQTESDYQVVQLFIDINESALLKAYSRNQ